MQPIGSNALQGQYLQHCIVVGIHVLSSCCSTSPQSVVKVSFDNQQFLQAVSSYGNTDSLCRGKRLILADVTGIYPSHGVCLLPLPSPIGFIFRGAMIQAGFFLPLVYSFNQMALLIVFAAFVSTGGMLVPRHVFTTLALTMRMKLYAVKFFVLQTYALSEATVALARIKVQCQSSVLCETVYCERLHMSSLAVACLETTFPYSSCKAYKLSCTSVLFSNWFFSSNS